MTGSVYRRLALGVKKLIYPGPAEPPYAHVCQIGDPVLREKSLPIPDEDLGQPYIQNIVQQLKVVMKSYKILGLAACQIGIPLRVVAFDFAQDIAKDLPEKSLKSLQLDRDKILVVMNPVLAVTNYDRVKRSEYCASVKGYSAVVPRYAGISLEGTYGDGTPCSIQGTGLLARVIQHEMEHLDGNLYVDTMDVSTFQNDGWQKINSFAGKVQINFLPEK